GNRAVARASGGSAGVARAGRGAGAHAAPHAEGEAGRSVCVKVTPAPSGREGHEMAQYETALPRPSRQVQKRQLEAQLIGRQKPRRAPAIHAKFHEAWERRDLKAMYEAMSDDSLLTEEK